MFATFRYFLLVFALFGLGAEAIASRVSPMIVDLEPSGRASTARVELINDGTRDIPYEVRMMRGVISPEGALELIPADEQFFVFPAQTIVESSSQQVFRVQYVGDSELGSSQIYYMSIRQIPVEFEQGVSQVQMVIHYNVLANVVPRGTTPEPAIRSITATTSEIPGTPDPANPNIEPDPVSVNGIQVDVGNDGTRYFLAGLSTWTISGTTESGEPYEQRYTGEEMSREIGVGVVGPDANRIFFVPTPAPLVSESISISIEP